MNIGGHSEHVFKTFNGELWKKLLIHKLGLLVGFYDYLKHLFICHIQSPIERIQMRENSLSRQEKIRQKIQ